MISEIATRSWCVATIPTPPTELQFFSGQCDGASKFYVDWRNAIPLTHIETMQVKNELEQAFRKRGDLFQVIWLGDVANDHQGNVVKNTK